MTGPPMPLEFDLENVGAKLVYRTGTGRLIPVGEYQGGRWERASE